MKSFLPFTLLLLSGLLTACPSTQTPTPVINLSGAWEGTLTHSDGQNVAVPLMITFTQSDNDLGGTASLGPVPYQSTGVITGSVEGEIGFAFSFVSGETGIGGEVEQTIGTYTFSAALAGNTLSGDFIATDDSSELSIPGTFSIKRQ